MYSRKVIDKRLRLLEKEWGFEPVYHSLEEVRQANEYINAFLDDEGNLKLRLGPTDEEIKKGAELSPEQKWIKNENGISQIDFRYWYTHYATVMHWDGHSIVRQPEMSVAQNTLVDIWGEMEEQKIAIAIQLLKARQLRSSTTTIHSILHRTNFWPDVNALIASSDPDKSIKLASMAELTYNNLPFWMQAPLTPPSRIGISLTFGNQNSAISIQHGNQFSGIARGTTPGVVHLCLSPHTLIRCHDGRVFPIKEVLVGHKVLTSKGRIANVKRVCVSSRRNEMTSEIWLWGQFSPLSVTRDHRILTPEGMREAHQIQSGDWVCYPVRKIHDTMKSFEVTTLSHAVRQEKEAIRTFRPTREFGWMLGLYLAEGGVDWTQRNNGKWPTRLTFSIDMDEVEVFEPRLRAAFGRSESLSIARSTSRTRTLKLNDSPFARWILNNIGHGDNKRLPDWAWECGEEFCKGILEGYIQGDGHISPASNEITATSIRLNLSMQMRELAASLGYGWSSIYYRLAGRYYGRNCQDSWNWALNGEAAQSLREDFGWPTFPCEEPIHWRYSTEKKFVEIQIDHVGDGYSDVFFDLEVDAPEHDFCTIHCCVSNSEIPDWSDPENLIDAALLKAMHPSAWMFLALESTAAEMGDWWHDTWQANVEGWPKHKSIIRPVFLPWFVGSDIYPSEADLKARPVPDDWNPIDMTYKHAERCAAFVKTNDYLRKYLGQYWKLPRHQMWYWECEYLAAKAKKGLAQFYSEMPASADDAFQSKSISVFDLDTIITYQEFRKPPKAVYAFDGIDIADRLKPMDHEIDVNKPPLEILPAWNIAHKTNPIRLVPLKWHGDSEDDGLDKLYIWHWPDPSNVYAMGVDLSDGVGLDRTVVEVMRKINYKERAAQCAEFASPYINSLDLWPISLAIGTLYSTMRDGEMIQPKAVIECRGNGDNTQMQMKLRGWTKFHLWSRLDNRKATAHLHATKIGWYTNVWSRAQMMDWIVKFLRDEMIEINSPWFIKEMRSLSRDESKQSFRADRGHHDDRICAMAFVLHSMHSFELTETDPSIAFDRVKRTFRGRWSPPEGSAPPQPQNCLDLYPDPAATDQFDREDLIPSIDSGGMVEW
jgi:hypothetical protein